jgi:phosphonate transport system permease protein
MDFQSNPKGDSLMAIEDYTKGRIIPIRKFGRSEAYMLLVILGLLITSVIGMFYLDTGGEDLGQAVLKTFQDLGVMFFRPIVEPREIGPALYGVLITLALALLTTVIGGVIALILGLLAAENLTNHSTSMVIRGFVSLIRAIPTEFWVLIFAIGAGLGSVAAVIGMTFHTIGYLIKAFSESFEEIDRGVIEALKASGANWFQIVFQAVLPSSATYLLSWMFVRFEVNFAVAVAMGAAAGAGGIGFDLFMASGFYFSIARVGFLTYLILAVALIMEWGATKLKTKIDN